MKMTCDIIRDLLPLYAEGLASADSAAAVREHLDGCERCSAELERMKEPVRVPNEELGMRKIKRGIVRRWLLGVTCAMLAILLAASCVGWWLFNPIYLPESAVTSVERNDRMSEPGDDEWIKIWASATKAGYRWLDCEGREWKEGNCYVTFYTCRYYEQKQEIPEEEFVSVRTSPGAVWLFSEEGDMKLLYGTAEDSEPPAQWSMLETMTLWAAAIGGVLLVLGLLLRKWRVGLWLLAVGSLGLCYAVCQWAVCGGSLLSFFPLRELLWAVLISGSAWGIGMCVCGMRRKV